MGYAKINGERGKIHMGRAGAGGGGRSSSGGGHSSLRSSGGHRVGGSVKRAGSGSSTSTGRTVSKTNVSTGRTVSKTNTSAGHTVSKNNVSTSRAVNKNSANTSTSRVGSGGSRSSGGGHSSLRSSGGHKVSESSRTTKRATSSASNASSNRSTIHQTGGSINRGFGSTMGRTGGFGGGYYRKPVVPPPPIAPMPPSHRYYGSEKSRKSSSSAPISDSTVFCVLFLALIMIIFCGCAVAFVGESVKERQEYGDVQSTIVRQKLETQNAYINDCIIDELGWFSDPTKMSVNLKQFWDETGIQPYIILKSYDASLETEDQKIQWATDYYDANFDTENIFLYVYFAEEDVDNDVGYMAYANGYQTSSVMDSEAVSIFWGYIDRYWYTDMETDDVFISVFQNTAKTIMHVSTTKNDIIKGFIMLALAVVVLIIIIIVLKQSGKRAQEKAEEDARILNTPIDDIVTDHLEDKYLNK